MTQIPDKLIDYIDDLEIWHQSKVKMYLGIINDNSITKLVKNNSIKSVKWNWYDAETVKDYKENKYGRKEQKPKVFMTIDSMNIYDGSTLCINFTSERSLANFIENVSKHVEIKIQGSRP